MASKKTMGFTLAELLISLAILGVIATFTIPKILGAQQNAQFNAVAKEDIAAITAAYQQAQLAGLVTSSFRAWDLTPYLNYVSIDTSTSIDSLPGFVSTACSASSPCMRMHNGSVIYFFTAVSFGGTASNNSIFVFLDPDGKLTTSTTNGPGKSVELHLFYNGRPCTRGTLNTSAVSSDMTRTADSTLDPSWFSW